MNRSGSSNFYQKFKQKITNIEYYLLSGHPFTVVLKRNIVSGEDGTESLMYNYQIPVLSCSIEFQSVSRRSTVQNFKKPGEISYKTLNNNL